MPMLENNITAWCTCDMSSGSDGPVMLTAYVIIEIQYIYSILRIAYGFASFINQIKVLAHSSNTV